MLPSSPWTSSQVGSTSKGSACFCFWFFSLAARADSYPLIWLCRWDPWCEKGSPKRVRFFQLNFKLRPQVGQLSGRYSIRNSGIAVNSAPLGTWHFEERKLFSLSFSEIPACFVIRTWSFSRLCYLCLSPWSRSKVTSNANHGRCNDSTQLRHSKLLCAFASWLHLPPPPFNTSRARRVSIAC